MVLGKIPEEEIKKHSAHRTYQAIHAQSRGNTVNSYDPSSAVRNLFACATPSIDERGLEYGLSKGMQYLWHAVVRVHVELPDITWEERVWTIF